ncbi:MAG: SH3 domain-containing protein [Rhodopirellula sp.]|nr:SH3 domain-containing protein [Rhodopirellula sp.]
MRLCCAMTAILAVSSAATAAAPSFPYKAYVTAEGVHVRSGPGNNYYTTDKLDVGAEVEVHRHDPGGWYAIRPPQGSFAWVSGRFLKLQKDRLATVIGDRVAARVGSRFSDIRDVIQVRLHRDELVEVLETKQIEGDPESSTWYKIAPPAGEFRWIFGKYVDPEYPHEGIRKAPPGNSPLVDSSPVVTESRSVAVRIPTDTSSSESATADRPDPPPSADAGKMEYSAVVQEPKASALPPLSATADAGYAQRFVEVRPGEPEPPAIRRMSPEEFQAELDDMNMALSVMLADEPSQWNCDGLARRAESLVAAAETALERGRARLLLSRVKQAQDICDRQKTLTAARTHTEQDSRRLGAISRTRAEAATDAEQAGEGRFDGVGRLARVVPASLGAPQFALKNDRGAVECFVSPAPGVNLQYYVGKRIGVSGVRGYLSEQKTAHVTAKHVTPFESNKLR